LQQQLFERIYEYIPQDAELFSSTQYLTELGQDLCDRPLASEKDLKVYQRLAVERPTTNIIFYFQQVKEACCKFNLSGSIIFENHANTFSNSNKDVLQSLQDLCISSKRQASSLNLKPQNANQICIYKEADGIQSLYIIVEYKLSYKLSVFNLQARFLQADQGSINILKDVINQITIPTNLREKFVYNSKQLTAAALIQTYKYIIENSLEYSKLATGEADVFFQLKEDKLYILYYYLAKPNIKAKAQNKVNILLYYTTIGQTSTFCLIALDLKPYSQK
jgi:hypothetical protein